MTDRELRELEDAQAEQRADARLRIEAAEQYVHDYRSRIQEVQERFSDFASREGIGDDSGFRDELRRSSDIVDQNVAYAGRKVAELEEENDQLLRDQTDERERYLAQRDTTD
ncbi:hypothetical protein ACRAWB_02340 [Leifsonia poae]|uniref:hypothetical protein n=1 Tax=Leifsonia poae TaxID=110933 RepID=UPI003D688700